MSAGKGDRNRSAGKAFWKSSYWDKDKEEDDTRQAIEDERRRQAEEMAEAMRGNREP